MKYYTIYLERMFINFRNSTVNIKWQKPKKKNWIIKSKEITYSKLFFFALLENTYFEIMRNCYDENEIYQSHLFVHKTSFS